MHPRHVRAERGVVPFPTERVDARTDFDTFVEEENERLYKALYFVTGSREDSGDLAQEAFMKLWERWGSIDQGCTTSRAFSPRLPRRPEPHRRP